MLSSPPSTLVLAVKADQMTEETRLKLTSERGRGKQQESFYLLSFIAKNLT